MENRKQQWLSMLTAEPGYYEFDRTVTLLRTFEGDGFYGEIYRQQNGKGTFQRVIMLFPKAFTGKLPGAVIPFYYPEAMMGYDPVTNEKLSYFAGIEMMIHLVKRGFAVISGESYHLTYLPDDHSDIGDFSRWKRASAALNADHPEWCGMGKLVADTSLLTDLFAGDERVDKEKLVIAGHSLGGKIAFYSGCLDDRFKAILCSDFGMGFEMSNWDDPWYWGEKLNDLKEKGLDHASLLAATGSKPICLLAGEFDTEKSGELIRGVDDRFLFVHHATGHRPPADALKKGYDFLESNL